MGRIGILGERYRMSPGNPGRVRGQVKRQVTVDRFVFAPCNQT